MAVFTDCADRLPALKITGTINDIRNSMTGIVNLFIHGHSFRSRLKTSPPNLLSKNGEGDVNSPHLSMEKEEIETSQQNHIQSSSVA
ncbi:MAG: hypothetical protein JXA10_02815, partial [Anaerolineae bacterium]|nr:hypothetical protein [Anaerolineae bacterium]